MPRKKSSESDEASGREFVLNATATVSLVKRVRAEDRDAALAIGDSLRVPRLCHNCASAGDGVDGSWEIDEVTYVVDGVEAEEASDG